MKFIQESSFQIVKSQVIWVSHPDSHSFSLQREHRNLPTHKPPMNIPVHHMKWLCLKGNSIWKPHFFANPEASYSRSIWLSGQSLKFLYEVTLGQCLYLFDNWWKEVVQTLTIFCTLKTNPLGLRLNRKGTWLARAPACPSFSFSLQNVTEQHAVVPTRCLDKP